jgi:hypothetical protein
MTQGITGDQWVAANCVANASTVFWSIPSDEVDTKIKALAVFVGAAQMASTYFGESTDSTRIMTMIDRTIPRPPDAAPLYYSGEAE